MINLLDYVMDSNDNFWIVNCIDNSFKGYMVYKVDDAGTRYNNITKKYYVKNIQKSISKIVPPFKRIFHAKEFYLENKKNLRGVWLDYVNALNDIGIPDKDIGIFGSYLIGFDIEKDVDFVIYGKDNLKKYYDNVNIIRDKIKATPISNEHIKYQYNKHKDVHNKNTDLLEIISRNWSGVQVSENVLSTPRFVDLNDQISPCVFGNKMLVTCEVISGLTSAMLPRKAKVLYNNEEYTMVSNLWKYQSFAHKGDVIECLAYVDDINKTIYLNNYDCYIKYLKVSDLID